MTDGANGTTFETPDGKLLGQISQLTNFRSADGSNRNTQHPDWGQANKPFIRLTPNAYADGTSAPAGANRPSARLISSSFCPAP